MTILSLALGYQSIFRVLHLVIYFSICESGFVLPMSGLLLGPVTEISVDPFISPTVIALWHQ